jgi:5-methylcytosine-specific restriction endonuclease McrA
MKKVMMPDRETFSRIVKESYTFSEIGRKIGYKVTGGTIRYIQRKIEDYGVDISHLLGHKWSTGLTKENSACINKASIKNELPWEEAFKKGSKVKNSTLLKKLVASGKRERACETCKIKDWQGKPITFELHHKNRIFNDNREENLEILCPNCHSQEHELNLRVEANKQKLEAYSKILTKELFNTLYLTKTLDEITEEIKIPHLWIQKLKKFYGIKAKTCYNFLGNIIKTETEKEKIFSENLTKTIFESLYLTKSLKTISKETKIPLAWVKKLKKIYKIKNNTKLLNRNCDRPEKRKFNIDRDILEKLVKSLPTRRISKILGVSDVAISKRCKRMGIKKPSLGFWSKKYSGNPPNNIKIDKDLIEYLQNKGYKVE